MTLRLSRRIPGLLLAAGVVYFFAVNSEVVWLYGLTALLLALIPVGLLAPLVTVRGIRIRGQSLSRAGFIPPLSQDRARVFTGDEVAVRLHCGGNLDAVRFVALRLDSGQVVECRDGEGREAVIILAPSRRGRLLARAVLVTCSWPLGILEVRRWVPLQIDFVSHPRYVVAGADSATGTTELSGEAVTRGVGEEFVGLREYRPGDSQRRVHWPTSARAGTLMVVETAVESRSRARYRVDLAPSASVESTDLAASVAASLAAGSVVAGRPFRLELPGGASGLVRWSEALAGLAMMQPGSPPRASDQAVTIAADADGVTVASGESRWRLSATASLEDVAAASGAGGEAP